MTGRCASAGKYDTIPAILKNQVIDLKQTKKTWISLLLVLSLLFSMTAESFAAPVQEDAAPDRSAQYLLAAVPEPQFGPVGGEWTIIGLARSGCDVPQRYWEQYYANVVRSVRDCGGVLHEKKYTEYSRLVLALTAIGADPENVAGYNLLTPLGDYDKTVWQGVNGAIWALIALDSGNYQVPVNAAAKTQATRQMYVDHILACQLADGGWSFGSGGADPDLTAMALQALAPYRAQKPAAAAIDAGLACLSTLQDTDGGYTSWGSANAESCAQVVIALCTLGVAQKDSRFVKNGCTVLDKLLSYRRADGGFAHEQGDTVSNAMASEQGLCALAAVRRAEQGLPALYRMSDGTISVPDETDPDQFPGKDSAVKKVPVSLPGATFSDVAGSRYQTAVEALAERGIITGRGNGCFDPDAGMTRSEFAAIVTRALGLTGQACVQFADVAADRWYAAPVGTAYRYGIVKGTAATTFSPDAVITRQEAAVMVTRAAALCGLNPALSDAAVQETLAAVPGGTETADWARSALAFCCRSGILEKDAPLRPAQAAARGEIAQMLYQMLDAAQLL